jgi:hypothetical protein
MATVLGTAATGVWAGLPNANALAAIAAVEANDRIANPEGIAPAWD